VRRDAVRAPAAPVAVASTPLPVEAFQPAPAPVEAVAPSKPESGHDDGAGVDNGQLAYLHAPPPRFPTAALRRQQQGTVLLEVLVDEQGVPRVVTLVRSSGYPLLDGEARRHVLKRWRFRPALRDGVAIPARGLVPLRFAIAAG
jgi:protein TonB